MKVLIIGLYNTLGGIEKCIYDYIAHMDLNGISIGFVGAPEHVWFEDEFKRLGCAVHATCARKNVVRYYRDLCRIIKTNGYDTVHLNMLSCANIVPLWAARKCGVRILVHSHNSSVPKGSLSAFLRLFLHTVNKRAVRKEWVKKLACSQEAGKFFFGSKCNFTVLANAIDTRRFSFDSEARIAKRRELGISDDTVVFGQVGRFEYQKNHQFTIRLFAEIVKKQPKSMLLLIGTGSLEEDCKRQVKALGIERNVMFCGQQDKIAPFLFAMDVFLFPSRFEGLGIVGLEAQCAGLPVIASTGISKEMEKTDLVSWRDLSAPLDDWVSAVEQSARHGRTRSGYAHKLADCGFDISAQAESLRSLYECKA